MRFYTQSHQHYRGIDRPARMMYVCILDHDGEILVHLNTKTEAKQFLKLIKPYREGLVISVECMFTGYWVADLCAREGIALVLGNALYMTKSSGTILNRFSGPVG